MKLTLNPLKLRQQVRYYATLCSKQCLALMHANEHIAELVAKSPTFLTACSGLFIWSKYE